MLNYIVVKAAYFLAQARRSSAISGAGYKGCARRRWPLAARSGVERSGTGHGVRRLEGRVRSTDAQRLPGGSQLHRGVRGQVGMGPASECGKEKGADGGGKGGELEEVAARAGA